jgi:hypothetical protein
VTGGGRVSGLGGAWPTVGEVAGAEVDGTTGAGGSADGEADGTTDGGAGGARLALTVGDSGEVVSSAWAPALAPMNERARTSAPSAARADFIFRLRDVIDSPSPKLLNQLCPFLAIIGVLVGRAPEVHDFIFYSTARLRLRTATL